MFFPFFQTGLAALFHFGLTLVSASLSSALVCLCGTAQLKAKRGDGSLLACSDGVFLFLKKELFPVSTPHLCWETKTLR